MLRATTIVRRPAVKPDRVVDTLTLDHEARHRRRLSLTGENGVAFLLDLERATILDDGDAVKLEDGRLVQIKAAPERLIEIRAETPLRLMKVAWHVGNRHVAAELMADALYIAHDHVLMEMVRGLGATATVVERPFRPERGAYETHGHDHGHEHGHGGDGHHVHGESCGCAHHGHGEGHGHDHGHHHGHHKHEH